MGLLFAVIVLSVSACKKDDDKSSSVRLEFTANYDGQDYAPFTEYTYFNGSVLTINKAVFYVSSIDLVKADGSTVRLSDVEYVDLSDPVNPSQASFVYDELPVGEFTALRLGIGVPADLNAKAPAEFSAGHPLAIESMHWDPWDSYIFSKTEGRIDTTGDGQGDLNFLYHTGVDDLYRGLEAQQGFELRDGEEKVLNFSLDLKKLFGTDANYIDIKAKPASHNPSDLDIATRVMDNYVRALSFSF